VDGAKRQPAVTIRPARPDDYEAIVAVWRAAGSHYELEGRERESAFREQLRHFGDGYRVAVEGERIVGVVLGSHDHRKGWINRLAVLPAFRRRGIAAALVQSCEAALRSRGLNVVCALVEPHNAASAELFKRLGFRDDVPIRYFRKSE
jgi:ribosomal protein S18 acetylase RimI-like enzyme